MCVCMCVCVCVGVYMGKAERSGRLAKETDNVSFTSSCETRDLLLNPWNESTALAYVHLFSV